MGYGLLLTYGVFVKIPVHRVGGPKNVWDTGGYGLSRVWVTGGSAVDIQVNATGRHPLVVKYT